MTAVDRAVTPQPDKRATTTIRVVLADAPTDVLAWLADQPVDRWWTPSAIAEGAAPDSADNALRSAIGAISTLFGCQYVEGRNVDGISMFRATNEGRKAIEVARA